MSNIIPLLAAVKIPAPDLKQIASVRERIAELNRILLATHRPKLPYSDDWRTELHLKVDAATAELQENPSLENAEKFHQAFMRHKESELTGNLISDTIGPCFPRISAELEGVVLKIIDSAESAFKAEADSIRAKLAAIDEASAIAHDIKTNGTLAAFASERNHAAADPAGWLARTGLAV
jgi:hypothetical protein